MRRQKFKILTGKKWSGNIDVIAPSGDDIIAQFDAEDPNAINERYVYDRTVMTAKEFEEWTGVDFRKIQP